MFKFCCQDNIIINIKHANSLFKVLKKKKKDKNKNKKEEKTFCFSFKNYTGNVNTSKVKMVNKMIREKSRCFNCNHKKCNFLKQN